MRTSLYLTAVLLIVSVSAIKAQTDTTHYDLGRILVKKNFTQSITIKGTDLERYQFSDLSDAINAWLYGTFTNTSSLVYVIDGNIITDVNAYSIYDIEEVTLIQNAAAQVSGASPAQQMVLIKTRSHPQGSQGVEAAEQTGLVDLRNRGHALQGSSTHNLYDQAYVSGYKNFTNANISASMDYQHDVFPEILPGSFSTVDPFHFDRFKFNIYANTKLWKGSTLSFNTSYAPQTSNEADAYITPEYPAGSSIGITDGTHISQHLFNSTVNINSHIVEGLSNILSASYNHYNYFQLDTLTDTYTNPGSSPNVTNSRNTAFSKEHTLLIRNYMVYHKHVGNFDLEPSLNFSYRNVAGANNYTELSYQGASLNSPTENISSSSSADSYKIYLLTPSFDVSYKDIFNAQIGFVSLLNPNKDFIPAFQRNRIFPFLTTMLDISKAAGISSFSLRVFGSFARQNEFMDDSYASLSGFGLKGYSSAVNSQFGTVGAGGSYYFYTYINPYQQFNNYQAGLALGLCKNLSFDYSFEYRYFVSYEEVDVPVAPNGGAFGLENYNAKSTTNRFGVEYNFDVGDFNWKTGLNTTESKLGLANASGYVLNGQYIAYLNTGHRWTGGFTNRFTLKNWFAGINMLYQLGERPYSLEAWIPGSPGYVAPSYNNSFALQNLYLGKKVRVAGLKYAEIYLDGRNLLQNKGSDITDERRFYGAGLKINL